MDVGQGIDPITNVDKRCKRSRSIGPDLNSIQFSQPLIYWTCPDILYVLCCFFFKGAPLSSRVTEVDLDAVREPSVEMKSSWVREGGRPRGQSLAARWEPRTSPLRWDTSFISQMFWPKSHMHIVWYGWFFQLLCNSILKARGVHIVIFPSFKFLEQVFIKMNKYFYLQIFRYLSIKPSAEIYCLYFSFKGNIYHLYILLFSAP